jgi:hypothetical protein
MRKTLIILPLLLVASPAVAQSAPQLPPELTDPATAQKLSNTAEALSDAVMSMQIGEVRAAVEGRDATPVERHITVGDLARRDDPDFDRHLHQKIASVGPRVQQSMRALNEALPAIMESLAQAKKSLERAVANMPDPTYPRR